MEAGRGVDQNIEGRGERQYADYTHQPATCGRLQQKAKAFEEQPDGDHIEKYPALYTRQNQAERSNRHADNPLYHEYPASHGLTSFAAQGSVEKRRQAVKERVRSEETQKEKNRQFWPENRHHPEDYCQKALGQEPPVAPGELYSSRFACSWPVPGPARVRSFVV